MKWLMYALAGIVGLIVLTVVVLLVLGGGHKEGRNDATVEIGRPPSAVFAWLRQPEKLGAWVGWLVEVRNLTPGKNGAGAKEVWVMEDRNNGNQRMNLESEVLRYEQDHLFEVRLSAPGGFTGIVTYALQPVGTDRTRLVYTSVIQYEHWLAMIFKPLISRSAQQKLEEDLARLKQKAEAE